MAVKIPDERYFSVSGWMLNRLGLKGVPLQVYAIIYGFSQDGESKFEGSLQYLCAFTGASRSTVIRALNELVEQCYVLKTESKKNGVQFNSYRAVIPETGSVKMTPGSYQNDTEGSSKMTLPPSVKMTPNNIDIKKIEENQEKKKEAPLFGAELQAAFDNWLQYKQERKEEYKPTGLKSLITEIRNNAAKYGEEAVAAEIRTSMARGWRGIVFDRLKEAEQRAAAPARRKEMNPKWMTSTGNDDMKKYVQELKKTAGNDPALAARAQALQESLKQ